jgi:hypothetical protein
MILTLYAMAVVSVSTVVMPSCDVVAVTMNPTPVTV